MLRKPNFFILGAPKCGTTSMANWLGEHPNIYMSPAKEPHFFDTDQRRRTTSIKEYEALFSAANESHTAIGEASVFYLFSNEAVPNIIRYSPRAKFIVMVRNPLGMAYSLHSFYCQVGRENIVSFADAWALDSERRQGRSIPPQAWDPTRMVYRDVCAVGGQIERLLTHVPPERLKIVFLEDVQRDARAVYREVLEFLGVRDDGRSQFATLNAARANRLQMLSNLSAAAYDLKHRLKIKRGIGFLNTIQKLNSKSRNAKHIDHELRSEVLIYFNDDISLLSRISSRNLDHWTH